MSEEISFPHPLYCDTDCIFVGGELSSERLKLAYSYGIFPWYNEGEDIHWYCPDPRFVLHPKDIVVSKSMRKYFNQNIYKVTYNQAFDKVIDQCQTVNRRDQHGTWITKSMKMAYTKLFDEGMIISVEVWNMEDQLVGGLYGVDWNGIFFGESMFALSSNASKFALIHLCKKLEKEHYKLIDCQVYTDHLSSMGAVFISKAMFLNYLSY